VPTVQANGITLEYESFGNEHDPVILLVMGLGLQMIAWPDVLCETLARRGYRVIRFDNRDCGLSTVFDHAGKPNIMLSYFRYLLHLPFKSAYSLDDMARDVVGLMDALRITCAHVVGASMGGMISQNLAARFPDRVKSLTSIMSTTGKRSLPKPEHRALKVLLRKPAKRGDFEGAVQRLHQLLKTIGSVTNPADPAYLRSMCERHVSRAYLPQGMARQLVAIAAADDRTPIVRTIARPTLVIHGAEDPLLPPECGRDTARAIPGARFELVQGMGHDLPLPLVPQLADLITTHCMDAK
jgi:pimeloyl-ACP methyl ester carboxylesterase